MGKKNKYKDLVGLSGKERVLRQLELAKISSFSSTRKNTKTKMKKAQQVEESSDGFTGHVKRRRRHQIDGYVDTADSEANSSSTKRKTKRKRVEGDLEPSTAVSAEIQCGEGKTKKEQDLKSRMSEKLSGARFRYINEMLYTTTGEEAMDLFSKDRHLFDAYHSGYQNQKRKWPFDPLDNVISQIKRMPRSHVIADMGCGDARLAASVKQTVHSFDLVANNDRVTAVDMSNVPLPDESVDVCVFCLSLMGTNLADYIREANRILKKGGVLKVVEIRSRFEAVGHFKRALEKLGFKLFKHVKLPDNYFIQMDFEKMASAKSGAVKQLTLKPCLYKKR